MQPRREPQLYLCDDWIVVRKPKELTASGQDEPMSAKNCLIVTLMSLVAEHAYRFSCRAADWPRSDFCSVPNGVQRRPLCQQDLF